MGHGGGSAPAGLSQHGVRTFFLRAPYADFGALAEGVKTEFRSARRTLLPELPTPVVLYAISSGGHKRWRLMVLTEYREQRLIDVAEEPHALAREGFRSYADFRSYWRARDRRGWDPMRQVGAYTLDFPYDNAVLGRLLLERVYGPYI